MPEQAPTLRDMIQEALSSGLTYRDMQTRAVDPDTGATVGKDLFNRIILGKVNRMPLEDELRAIAAGLRAPYESVRQAAITQWLPADGERPRTPPAPPGIDPKEWAKMPPEGRQMVLDAIKLASKRAARKTTRSSDSECMAA